MTQNNIYHELLMWQNWSNATVALCTNLKTVDTSLQIGLSLSLLAPVITVAHAVGCKVRRDGCEKVSHCEKLLVRALCTWTCCESQDAHGCCCFLIESAKK